MTTPSVERNRMPFPDTGPQPDGTRTAEQWFNAIGEDVGTIHRQLRESLDDTITPGKKDKALACAIARKEANRLLSDIRRFAQEVHDLSPQDLDDVGPL